MSKGHAGRRRVHDVAALDSWEIRGGEHAGSRRIKRLAIQDTSLSRCQFSEHRAYPSDWLRETETETTACSSVQTVNCHGLQWAAKTRHGPLAATQPQQNL